MDIGTFTGRPAATRGGGAYYDRPFRPRTPDSAVVSLEQRYGRNMLPNHMDAIAKSFPDLVIMAHLGGDAAYFQQAALICNGHAG